MKIKKIATFKNLKERHAREIAKTYSDRGFEIEMIPIYINNKSLTFAREEDTYELHVYELIRRDKRWYTYDQNIK